MSRMKNFIQDIENNSPAIVEKLEEERQERKKNFDWQAYNRTLLASQKFKSSRETRNTVNS